MQYLLDTNILLKEIASQGSLTGTIHEEIAAISTITVMEVLALPGLSANEEKQIRAILHRCLIFPVDFSVAELAGQLQRTRKKKMTTDLLIAATAIVNNCVLISRNIRDFKGIPNLQVRNEI